MAPLLSSSVTVGPDAALSRAVPARMPPAVRTAPASGTADALPHGTLPTSLAQVPRAAWTRRGSLLNIVA